MLSEARRRRRDHTPCCWRDSTASLGVRKVMAARTGPKISCWAIYAGGMNVAEKSWREIETARGGDARLPAGGAFGYALIDQAPDAVNWTRAMMAPMSMDLSRGGPTRSMRSQILAMRGSAMLSCIKRRRSRRSKLGLDAVDQAFDCESRSASSKMMKGDLPPSFRELLVRRGCRCGWHGRLLLSR